MAAINKIQALFLLLLTLCAAQVQAAITLDETAGTNMVGQVTSTMSSSGNLILPIMLAVLLIGGGLGLYRALASKARVKT